ncbi:MAG: tetratricopeptide repeat protein [Erythrobacter sp.]|nr:tetratricopeptide repeat protein [Erythrobacter sp.]MDZ4272673.1 tetratricopeptide repeat protein [Erythrobacter sp.]
MEKASFNDLEVKIVDTFNVELGLDPLRNEVEVALEMREINIDKAIEQLKILSDKGSAVSAHALADIFAFGHYQVDKDHAKAMQYFSRAKGLGSIEARYRLGRYHEFRGECNEALIELTSLAESGFAPASFLLGDLFQKGRPFGLDVERAMYFFDLAASQGHLLGRQWVGHLTRKRGGITNFIKGTVIILKTIRPIIKISKINPNDNSIRTW